MIGWVVAALFLAAVAVAVTRLTSALGRDVLGQDFWDAAAGPRLAATSADDATASALTDLGRRADALRDRVHDVTDGRPVPGSSEDLR